MKVVLDINVLLVSIPKKSKYRPIFDALISGYFHSVITFFQNTSKFYNKKQIFS